MAGIMPASLRRAAIDFLQQRESNAGLPAHATWTYVGSDRTAPMEEAAMSVFDDYLVDPRLSLLDKTRIQAQVLVPVLKALRAEMGKAKADALVRQALRDW